MSQSSLDGLLSLLWVLPWPVYTHICQQDVLVSAHGSCFHCCFYIRFLSTPFAHMPKMQLHHLSLAVTRWKARLLMYCFVICPLNHVIRRHLTLWFELHLNGNISKLNAVNKVLQVIHCFKVSVVLYAGLSINKRNRCLICAHFWLELWKTNVVIRNDMKKISM